MIPYLSLMIWDAPCFRTWIRTFNPNSWKGKKNEVSLVHGRIWTRDLLILRPLCYNLPQFFFRSVLSASVAAGQQPRPPVPAQLSADGLLVLTGPPVPDGPGFEPVLVQFGCPSSADAAEWCKGWVWDLGRVEYDNHVVVGPEFERSLQVWASSQSYRGPPAALLRFLDTYDPSIVGFNNGFLSCSLSSPAAVGL